MKRTLSLFLAAVAIVAVPGWAFVEAARMTGAMRAGRGLVCGVPLLGVYLLALIGSALLSASSLILGVLAYRELPQPRPFARKVELLVIGAPFAAVATFLIAADA